MFINIENSKLYHSLYLAFRNARRGTLFSPVYLFCILLYNVIQLFKCILNGAVLVVDMELFYWYLYVCVMNFSGCEPSFKLNVLFAQLKSLCITFKWTLSIETVVFLSVYLQKINSFNYNQTETVLLFNFMQKQVEITI